MTFVPVLLTPAVLVAALLVQRRLGPSAAGWVAALPISFTVALVAVTPDAGDRTAAAMALSAAAHVPAQVAFGLAAATVLVRRGLVAGIAAGALAYAGGSLVLAVLPTPLGLAVAVFLLGLAPRLMPAGRPAPGAAGRWPATVVTCLAATAVVLAAVLTARLAGPALAGAVIAFPTMCCTLTIVVGARDGRAAGAFALTGLVRSLPCYLAFGLTVAVAAPAIGPAALALGGLACLAVGRATWRGVPVAATDTASTARRRMADSA